MARIGLVVLLLILIPGVNAAKVDVVVGDEFDFETVAFLSGHVVLDGPEPIVAPAWVEAKEMAFPDGTLTVCPLTAPRGTLVEALSLLTQDCVQGESFEDVRLEFGNGTHLQAAGNFSVSTWPQATTMAVTGGTSHRMAMLLPPLFVRFAQQDDLWRFAALTGDGTVVVHHAGGKETYNGTDHAFLQDSEQMTIQARGWTGSIEGPLKIRLDAADTGALRQLPEPFAFLDLQAVAEGPDARQSRGNVSAVFREFGRVAEFVNGALHGHLNGSVHGRQLEAVHVSLARGDTFRLFLEGERLNGTYEPHATIARDGISLDGGPTREGPWALGLLLVVGAMAVALVRRDTPRSTVARKSATFGALILAGTVVDQAILAARLGPSAWGLLADGRIGDGLALATFEAVLLLLAAAFFWWPFRSTLRRTVPQRLQIPADLGLALLWVLSFLVFGAYYFALAFDLARL